MSRNLLNKFALVKLQNLHCQRTVGFATFPNWKYYQNILKDTNTELM